MFGFLLLKELRNKGRNQKNFHEEALKFLSQGGLGNDIIIVYKSLE